MKINYIKESLSDSLVQKADALWMNGTSGKDVNKDIYMIALVNDTHDLIATFSKSLDTLDDFLIKENLPSEFRLYPFEFELQEGKISNFYGKRNSSLFLMTTGPIQERHNLERALKGAICVYMRKKGIPVFAKPASNDIIYTKDGYEKKFAGFITKNNGKNMTLACAISFDVDTELLSNIYNFDHFTFTRKPDVDALNRIANITNDYGMIDLDEFTSSIIDSLSVTGYELNQIEEMEDLFRFRRTSTHQLSFNKEIGLEKLVK